MSFPDPGLKEATTEHVRVSGQKKLIGGIVIPSGPPPELLEAAIEALIVIAAWKISDDEHPYREVGTGIREGFRKVHDLLMNAIPGGDALVNEATKRWEEHSVLKTSKSSHAEGVLALA